MTVLPNVRILWHDDDLNSDRREAVAAWRDWFERYAQALGATTVFTESLARFVEVLSDQHQAPFDLLVLDVMLKHERETDFGLFNLPKERLLRLDAGAQMAGFLRSEAFDGRLPGWFERYRATPLMLLSFSPMASELILTYVDGDRREGLKSVIKDVKVLDNVVTVNSQFDRAMRDLIDVARRGKRT